MNKLFDDEIIEKFNDISNKLYNLKYSYELFFNYLENETTVPVEVICLGLIIKEYFEKAKRDYNNLEEELGVLL